MASHNALDEEALEAMLREEEDSQSTFPTDELTSFTPRWLNRRFVAALGLSLAVFGCIELAPSAQRQDDDANLLQLFGFPKLPTLTPSPAVLVPCLANEELYGGMCYQKCSILTNGKATYRKGPEICCSSNFFLCGLMKSMSTTSPGLAVGGGDASESQPHAPGVGSDCLRNEEPHAGLCYKSCKNLTNGEMPIRTSPFECCAGSDFAACVSGAGKTKFSSDFGVGGGQGEKALPHSPSDINSDNLGSSPNRGPPLKCLDDEEDFMGICYKKCSLLTQGSKNYRTGPDSCCSSAGSGGIFSFFSCMLPSASKTSVEFSTGGGSLYNKDPHPAGMSRKCLEDEEMVASLCYKKCSLLTKDKPVRLSAMSCCKDVTGLDCTVAAGLGIGGFAADGLPHLPYMKS